MRAHLHRLQVCLLAVSLAIATEAKADLTKTCFFTDVGSGSGYGTPDPSVPWFSSGATVDVYYSRSNAGYDYRPWTATGLTEAQFVAATLKSIAIWNEQSGARLRLRYKGPYGGTAYTCDQSLHQQCAIVIIGEQMNDDFSVQQRPTSPTRSSPSISPIDSGKAWSGSSGATPAEESRVTCCHGPGIRAAMDVVRTMTHELGHVAFAMGHQDVNNTTSDCTKFTPSRRSSR